MLIDSGLLPEAFATTHREDEDGPHGKRQEYWWHKALKQCSSIGKRMLFVGLHLSHINFRQRLNPNIKTRDPLWSDITQYFFHYFTFQSLFVIYYQYVFDYHHYYLARFDQMAELCRDENAPPMRDLEEARRRLVDNYESARNASKVIGAPYMHANYIMPIFCLLTITLCPLVYLVPQYYMKFDTGVVRYLIQPPDEAQHPIDAMIRDRVNDFILSSRVFSQVHVQRDASDGGRKEFCSKKNEQEYNRQREWTRDTCTCDDRPSTRVQRHRVLWDHKFLVAQAKFMAYEGKLQPYNRRRGWREMGNIYFVAYSFLAPLMLLMWLAFSILLPILMQFEVETDLMDWVFRVGVFMYTALPLEMSVIWNLFGVILCVDQAHTISKLCDLIDACIRRNARILLGHLRIPRLNETEVDLSGLGQDSSAVIGATNRLSIATRERVPFDLIAQRINVPLLYVILHYKIFVRQLRMQFDMMALWASIALVLATTPAVLLRLLAVYLSRRDKAIMVTTSACFFIEINIGLVIICRLHERCLDLYKRLQSLMAHVIESEQIVKTKYNCRCYNEHLVEVLRRELGHPGRVTHHFSAKIPLIGLNITYGNLLRYDFWYGVWAISSLLVDYSRPDAQDIFGRVWRFYSSADEELNEFFSNCTRPGQ